MTIKFTSSTLQMTTNSFIIKLYFQLTKYGFNWTININNYNIFTIEIHFITYFHYYQSRKEDFFDMGLYRWKLDSK